MMSWKAIVGLVTAGLWGLGACSSSDSTPAAADAATGGSAGTGNGSCPDMSGAWKITSHCQQSAVGTTATVTQSGCTLSDIQPWTGWQGTIDSKGGITMSGPAGSANMTCTGTLSGSQITMSCNPTCDVALVRP